MAQVTSPIILDSTGQQIHSDLQQIKNVLTTPSAAADITFDNTGTGMQADDVQDAITELKSNLTDFGVPISNSNTFTVSAVNCNASNILNELFYKIVGDNLIICGRARITVSSRTGNNCGLKVTIPNSRTITLSSKCSNYVAPSYYSDGFRNGEATMLEFDSGTNDYFYIRVSESYANVSTKILCLTIPYTVIKLDKIS